MAPKLSLVDTPIAELATDVVIIGTIKGEDGVQLAAGSDVVAEALPELLTLLTALGATGGAEEVVKVPSLGKLQADVIYAVGLGKAEPSAEQVRRAAGSVARSLAGTKKAASTLSLIDLGAAAEGTILGAYQFTEYKSAAGKAAVGKVELLVTSADKAAKAELKQAVAVANAVSTTRDFINTPPNDLYPASFAERAEVLATKAGLEVEILDEKGLKKGGFGGILGVGSGSSRLPRLVRIKYSGPKPVAKIALVGKGITFDTGGISLKPPAGMDEMTSDMSGAAAVISAVLLAAELKYPLDVTATVPMAENMPSGTAYRPGDVLKMYGGTTVEVLNTDAEGRLILADAIVRASEDHPDYLIDVATLTGAQLVALGQRTAGVMGTEIFRDRVAAIAQETGEGGWAMPIPEELREGLDSKLADLANITGTRWGGMLAAASFLQEFVGDDVEWAHLDVAGPAYNTGAAYGYTTKGGTGQPVRTLNAVFADIVAKG